MVSEETNRAITHECLVFVCGTGSIVAVLGLLLFLGLSLPFLSTVLVFIAFFISMKYDSQEYTGDISKHEYWVRFGINGGFFILCMILGGPVVAFLGAPQPNGPVATILSFLGAGVLFSFLRASSFLLSAI